MMIAVLSILLFLIFSVIFGVFMMSCYWQLKTLEQSCWEIEPSQARTGKPNLWLAGPAFFVHRAGKNLFKIIEVPLTMTLF